MDISYRATISWWWPCHFFVAMILTYEERSFAWVAIVLAAELCLENQCTGHKLWQNVWVVKCNLHKLLMLEYCYWWIKQWRLTLSTLLNINDWIYSCLKNSRSGDSLEIMSMEHILCFALPLRSYCYLIATLLVVVRPLNWLIDHMFCYIMLNDLICDGGDYLLL